MTTFGQGSQASPNPAGSTQEMEIAVESAAELPIELTTLGAGPSTIDVYATLENGVRQNDTRFYQEKAPRDRCSFFRNLNKKKVAAICVSAAIVGGVSYLAVASSYWNAAADCKTIYYPASKICSFDKGELIKYNPGTVQRGMYLSLWTNEVMRLAENPKYAYILGNDEKENQVLDFIDRHHIDALSLYNLGVIFDTQGMAEMLSTFIIKAKNHGIKEIIGIGEKASAFDTIADFQKRYPG
ncbi:MAG: hypothetical protein ABI041_09945, partial [Bdellovibrionia bacterium]